MKLYYVEGCICTLYIAVYEEEKKVLLLDGGCAQDFHIVADFLKEKEIEYDSLTAVASHAHPDHFGSLFKWKEVGANVIGPKKINEWYGGFGGFLQHRFDSGLALYIYNGRFEMSETRRVVAGIMSMITMNSPFGYPIKTKLTSEINISDAVAPNESLDTHVPIDETLFPDWKAIVRAHIIS